MGAGTKLSAKAERREGLETYNEEQEKIRSGAGRELEKAALNVSLSQEYKKSKESGRNLPLFPEVKKLTFRFYKGGTQALKNIENDILESVSKGEHPYFLDPRLKNIIKYWAVKIKGVKGTLPKLTDEDYKLIFVMDRKFDYMFQTKYEDGKQVTKRVFKVKNGSRIIHKVFAPILFKRIAVDLMETDENIKLRAGFQSGDKKTLLRETSIVFDMKYRKYGPNPRKNPMDFFTGKNLLLYEVITKWGLLTFIANALSTRGKIWKSPWALASLGVMIGGGIYSARKTGISHPYINALVSNTPDVGKETFFKKGNPVREFFDAVSEENEDMLYKEAEVYELIGGKKGVRELLASSKYTERKYKNKKTLKKLKDEGSISEDDLAKFLKTRGDPEKTKILRSRMRGIPKSLDAGRYAFYKTIYSERAFRVNPEFIKGLVSHYIMDKQVRELP